MRDRRDNQGPIVLEADEAAVEKVIDGGGEQQSILPVQSLLICSVPPRLAVARYQVVNPFDLGYRRVSNCRRNWKRDAGACDRSSWSQKIVQL